MTENEWETAYHTLLQMITGIISIADIYRTREKLENEWSQAWEDYYNRSIEEHCGMSFIKNPIIH